MNRSLLQLACAAAIGVLAASAQAQYSAPSAPSATPAIPATVTPPPADAGSRVAPGSISSAPDTTVLSTPDSEVAAGKAEADADFRAAQAACNGKTITDRDNCLLDAQENYSRALDESGNSSLQDQHSDTYFKSPNSSERGPGVPSGATSVPSGTASTGDVTGK